MQAPERNPERKRKRFRHGPDNCCINRRGGPSDYPGGCFWTCGRPFGNSSTNSGKTETEQKTEESASNMATVPDLVGKTEDEAKTLANDAHLGVQMAGEESSNQEKARFPVRKPQRELRWKNIQL